MFKKTAGKKAAQDAGEIGLLGMDTRFIGNICFRGTLRIDGIVEGNVTSKEGSGSVLIINRHAAITGNIISDSVMISGRVLGNILAVERVEILRSGSLRGDLFTGDILIEGQGEFEGNCRMIKNLDQALREKILQSAFTDSKGLGKSHSKIGRQQNTGGNSETLSA